MDKNYETYGPLELAQDELFIRWVRRGDEEAARFWEQWLAAHPEKVEVVEEARQVVQSIRLEEKPVSRQRVERLWARIDEEIGQSEQTRKRSALYVPRWLGYAAAAAAAILILFIFYNPGTTVQAPVGQHLTYRLPDGSSVSLNADSRLWFNENNWQEERRLELEGEAFFEVEKGNRFVVVTPSGEVEVLGTSFNVFAREAALEVECFTGKVRVSTSPADSLSLFPGQATRLTTADTLSRAFEADLERAAAWREGRFYLRGVTLSRVLSEIERQFDLNIDLRIGESKLDQPVDVYFEKTNPDSALYRATWPFGLEYRRDGRKVIIE